jgi:hypothetical protein
VIIFYNAVPGWIRAYRKEVPAVDTKQSG